MTTLRSHVQKLLSLIVVVGVAICALSFTAPQAAASCAARGIGNCAAPNGIACPLANTCCSTIGECQIEEGNVTPQDENFTPQGMRDDISGIINLDSTLDSPGAILSALLPYLFVFGGLILLVMLIWGGFEMLGGATNPKASENGKNRITASLTGFAILFAAIWIAQLAETLLGINILNN